MAFSFLFIHYNSPPQHFIPKSKSKSKSKSKPKPKSKLQQKHLHLMNSNSNDLYNPDFNEKTIHDVPDINDDFLQFMYGKV